jgi:hypothetical protein
MWRITITESDTFTDTDAKLRRRTLVRQNRHRSGLAINQFRFSADSDCDHAQLDSAVAHPIE